MGPAPVGDLGAGVITLYEPDVLGLASPSSAASEGV